jgi:hypothetical protein
MLFFNKHIYAGLHVPLLSPFLILFVLNVFKKTVKCHKMPTSDNRLRAIVFFGHPWARKRDEAPPAPAKKPGTSREQLIKDARDGGVESIFRGRTGWFIMMVQHDGHIFMVNDCWEYEDLLMLMLIVIVFLFMGD